MPLSLFATARRHWAWLRGVIERHCQFSRCRRRPVYTGLKKMKGLATHPWAITVRRGGRATCCPATGTPQTPKKSFKLEPESLLWPNLSYTRPRLPRYLRGGTKQPLVPPYPPREAPGDQGPYTCFKAWLIFLR